MSFFVLLWGGGGLTGSKVSLGWLVRSRLRDSVGCSGCLVGSYSRGITNNDVYNMEEFVLPGPFVDG